MKNTTSLENALRFKIEMGKIYISGILEFSGGEYIVLDNCVYKVSEIDWRNGILLFNVGGIIDVRCHLYSWEDVEKDIGEISVMNKMLYIADCLNYDDLKSNLKLKHFVLDSLFRDIVFSEIFGNHVRSVSRDCVVIKSVTGKDLEIYLDSVCMRNMGEVEEKILFGCDKECVMAKVKEMWNRRFEKFNKWRMIGKDYICPWLAGGIYSYDILTDEIFVFLHPNKNRFKRYWKIFRED